MTLTADAHILVVGTRATAGRIGNMLSASPMGADGAWPAETVREVLDLFRSKSMLKLLDGALPQAYDKSNNKGDGFIERCIDSYRAKGFDAVYPTLGATESSAARVYEQLLQMPKGVRGVSWWSWTAIGQSELKKAAIARWDARS